MPFHNWQPIPGACVDIDGASFHKDGEHCQHCGFGIDAGEEPRGYWHEPIVRPDLKPKVDAQRQGPILPPQSPPRDEGDALQAVKDCVKRNLENMPQLPCRVEEMTPREHEIFNILAGLCGALEFIGEVLEVHALAERPEADATATTRQAEDALRNLFRYLSHSSECHTQTPGIHEHVHLDCFCGLNQAKRRFAREVLVLNSESIEQAVNRAQP